MQKALLWLAVLAGWTLLAVVFAVSSSLTYALTYQPPQWNRTFAMALTEWYAWAALTPLVVWLARRLQLRRAAWVRRALVLAALGLAVAFLKVSLTRMARDVAGVREYFLLSNLTTHYLIYWGIIAVVHVHAYYRGERDRELRVSHAEARLADARLQLLRMQLHPHFLFNTLNAIAELVHENPVTAERMITGLSQLLRETLDSGGVDLVPLDRELELTSRYLDIQRCRFGDRLSARIERHEDASKALVPIFILQPLVENSIKHGIGAHRFAGSIIIRARKEADRLVMEVEDDGPGLDPAAIDDGIGLSNTRERLRAVYGDSHVFDVSSGPAGGARVRLVIPFETDSATTVNA
jgi:two-component system LytT family sensor kinase